LVPMISQMSLYQADPLYFFGNDVMFIETKRYKLSFMQRALKRAFDIVAASLGILVLLIPLLVIARRLKKESPEEPILYSGERVGKGQKTFRCWKFRTMESNSDHVLEKYLSENPEEKAYWDRYLKLPDDPRVTTSTTKFIRKTSIDELPQLWNVLVGDMSIVGPRPILPKEIELYGSPIKDYASVKPGITGLWQVSGRSETSFNRRIVWDRWYIRNWSYWGDLVIIIKTVLVVLNGRGAA
jgi:lipopolysaccharide/colanic/teichoic acid biosynthesis glycosyltransferase